MRSLPVCLLCTPDPELTRRLSASLQLIVSVRPLDTLSQIDACLQQLGPSVLLLDLRQKQWREALMHIGEISPMTVVAALGMPRSEPALEAEGMKVFAVDDVALDPPRVQELVTRALDHLHLKMENSRLKEEASATAMGQPPADPNRSERGLVSVPLRNFSRAFRHFDNVDVMFESIVEGIANAASVSRAGAFFKVRGSGLYKLRAGLRCLEETHLLEFTEQDPLVRWLAMNAHMISHSTLEHVRDPVERDMLKRCLNAMGAEVILPLHDRGRISGWLFVGTRLIGVPFAYADLDDLTAAAEHVSIAIENALLYEEVTVQKTLAETLLQTIPTGIVAVSADGMIRWFNDAAHHILDIDPTAVMNRSAEALGSRLSDLLRRALGAHDLPEAREWTDPLTKRSLSVQTRRLTDGDKCLGAVVLVHDLTNAKLLREKQEELDRTAFWSELTAAMSHEIRNPLVAISTFAQLLPDRYADPEFRTEFSHLVRQEVNRLNAIIEQISAFAHPPKPSFKTLNTRLIIQKAADLALSRQAPARNVKLETTLPETLPSICGDAYALTECFSHIITNAVEAVSGSENPRVVVKAKDLGGRNGNSAVAVTVSDNGNGIPDQLRDKVFSPFCTTKAKGLGLGLPIAKRTVADHGGKINVDTGPNGTSITVVLPVEDREEPDETHSDRG